jgi:hypothetical protein
MSLTPEDLRAAAATPNTDEIIKAGGKTAKDLLVKDLLDMFETHAKQKCWYVADRKVHSFFKKMVVPKEEIDELFKEFQNILIRKYLLGIDSMVLLMDSMVELSARHRERLLPMSEFKKTIKHHKMEEHIESTATELATTHGIDLEEARAFVSIAPANRYANELCKHLCTLTLAETTMVYVKEDVFVNGEKIGVKTVLVEAMDPSEPRFPSLVSKIHKNFSTTKSKTAKPALNPNLCSHLRQFYTKCREEHELIQQDPMLESPKGSFSDQVCSALEQILMEDVCETLKDFTKFSWGSPGKHPVTSHFFNAQEYAAADMTFDAYSDPEEFARAHCPAWLDWLSIAEGGGPGGPVYNSSDCFCAWFYRITCESSINTTREVFFVSGGGRTGNSTVGRVLVDFFGPVGTNVSTKHSNQFTFKKYEDKHLGVVCENHTRRLTADSDFLNISGNDAVTVEAKGRPAYTSVIHLAMIVFSNKSPLINKYNNAEYSRTYTLSMKERTNINENAENELMGQIYMFRRYCKSICDRCGERIMDGNILAKPADMVKNILIECSTRESKAVRKFFSLCAKDKAKETLSKDDVVAAICRLTENCSPDKVEDVLEQAAKSNKEEWISEIVDEERIYRNVTKGKLKQTKHDLT